MYDYALFDAAFSNDAAAITRAVHGGADPNKVHPQSGNTPLQVAAQCKSLDAVDALLRLGADPNLRFEWRSRVDGRTYGNRTALMYAATGDIARRLITASADINAVDANGWSALGLAVYCTNREVVDVLLAAGADTNLTISLRGKVATIPELIAEKIEHLEQIEGDPPKPEVREMLQELSDIQVSLNKVMKNGSDWTKPDFSESINR
jgi:ankyrin repeat protein